jgi:hypothetical protein
MTSNSSSIHCFICGDQLEYNDHSLLVNVDDMILYQCDACYKEPLYISHEYDIG